MPLLGWWSRGHTHLREGQQIIVDTKAPSACTAQLQCRKESQIKAAHYSGASQVHPHEVGGANAKQQAGAGQDGATEMLGLDAWCAAGMG